MKRFLQAAGLTALLAVTGLGWSGVAQAEETAGGVFVTGHDPDYHAYEGPGPRSLIKKSIDFVTGHKEHPSILLVTDIRDPGPPWRDSRGGMRLAGFTDFDVADYGSGLPGALDLRTIDFHEYDAVVVASDYGGWLRNDEIKVLNARAGDLVEYVNAGGGLVAFAESRYQERFQFLPFLVSYKTMTQVDTGMKLTDYGRAMGLTQADVTSGISHNIFTESGGMEVVDTDGEGNIVTLATKKKITLGGVEAAPIVTATADREPNANGWYNDDVTVSFAAEDDNEVVSIDSAVVVSTEGEKQEVKGTATDTSGLVGEGMLTVSLDKTASVVDVTLNGETALHGDATLYGSDGLYGSDALNGSDALKAVGAEGVVRFYTQDLRFELSASDGLSGVDVVEYRVNGGEWASYASPVALAEEGAYVLDVRTVDKAGNAVEKTVRFAIDKTAPSLQVHVDQETLWSPNHKLVPIRVTVAAEDAGSGVASVVLESITSNEPGEDDIQGASFGTADTEFQLRAERDGKGEGRVYTITYTVTDLAGNRTTATTTVTVAHDRSDKNDKGGKKK